MKLYNIALNNLRRRKGKMAFLVLGLMIGIATIVTLLAITDTMSGEIEERLDQFGANIVMVPRSENLSLTYGGISVGGVNYESVEFDEEKIQLIHEIDNSKNLGVVLPKVLGAVDIGGRRVLLMGTDFNVELNLKSWWTFSGSTPGRGELMAGAEAAAALGLAPGGSLDLGGRTFTVAAVLHATGGAEDGVLIGNLAEIQEVLGKQGKISMVEIAAFCRGCPISDMVLQIAEKFPEAKVTALKQAVMSKMQSIELFRTFAYGIAVLVIVIGSLLVFVTMMGAVNERTREIGIFRAIGFRRGHVMHIILLEALAVGMIGGILGFVGGSGVAWAVMPYVLPGGRLAGMNFSLGAVAVGMSMSLSLLASLYPARRASRLDPSVALRAL